MSRRAIGWLLLLAWPGLAAGVVITAALLWDAPEKVALAGWAFAAAGSGTAGHWAASSPPANAKALPALGAFGGFMAGAAVYFSTLAIFEAWRQRAFTL
jgi:hypothetical protein